MKDKQIDYTLPFKAMKDNNVPINERLLKHHQYSYFKESLNTLVGQPMQMYISPNKDLVITTKWSPEGLMSDYQRIVSVAPTTATKDYFVANGKKFYRDFDPSTYKPGGLK